MKTSIAVFALIFCLISSAGAATKALDPVFADLDGDGVKEKIWVSSAKDPRFEYTNYTLHIDKSSQKIPGEVPAFSVVHIDKADHHKEIDAVSYDGSDIPTHYFYSYDGKTIKEIGSLFGRPTFSGNGIILNSMWTGYVRVTEKYVLTKEKKLKAVPQDIYYVGDAHKVAKGFPIYCSRTSKDIVANLETSSKITIIGYAPAEPFNQETEAGRHKPDWVLIKTQYGLLGWATIETVSEFVEGMQGAG